MLPDRLHAFGEQNRRVPPTLVSGDLNPPLHYKKAVYITYAL